MTAQLLWNVQHWGLIGLFDFTYRGGGGVYLYKILITSSQTPREVLPRSSRSFLATWCGNVPEVTHIKGGTPTTAQWTIKHYTIQPNNFISAKWTVDIKCSYGHIINSHTIINYVTGGHLLLQAAGILITGITPIKLPGVKPLKNSTPHQISERCLAKSLPLWQQFLQLIPELFQPLQSYWFHWKLSVPDTNFVFTGSLSLWLPQMSSSWHHN